MTPIEQAARQALEALNEVTGWQWAGPMRVMDEVGDAIAALREALSGVQALSAAPAVGDELRDTLVAVSAAIAEQDDRTAQKMIREILEASPTPPAEQATTTEAATPKAGVTTGAALGGVYAELPQPDSWFHFTPQYWENTLRDFADRTHALRVQAASKAAPGEPDRADATNLARNTIKYPDLQITAKGVLCLAEAVLEMDKYIAKAPQPAPAPLSDDTKRLAWMADEWTPGHEKLYDKHVLETGGVGGLDDLRTFIDKQIAAQEGRARLGEKT